MNIADSEEMAAHLLARGYMPTEKLDEADLALINTCTVRDHAEHRALSFLGRLRKWKRENPKRIIIFAGCAAQRLGEKLKKTFPYLDLVSGAKEIDRFAELLDNSALFTPSGPQENKPQSSITGYVTIMRGCDFKCSYCIVPSVRGPVQCLPSAEILKNAAQKAAQGYKEIVLLGQTVNAWKEEGKTFADLLNEVSSIEGVERVRFVSPHPIFITNDFLKAVENNPKIARHIHLPVQSGSTKVLQEMKRGYSREILLEKLDALKERGFAISTDIIVGFPTETEADFQETLSLVERVHFSAAYCFKYSPRQGTPAAEMTLFPEKILEERLDILLNKVKGLAESAYRAQLGKPVQILMETPNKGRTSDNFWAQTQKEYPIGSVVNTEVVSVEDTLLLTRD